MILADVLRRAGADVRLASVEEGLEVEGSSGTRIEADVHISDCAHEVFDLVALPVINLYSMLSCIEHVMIENDCEVGINGIILLRHMGDV